MLSNPSGFGTVDKVPPAPQHVILSASEGSFPGYLCVPGRFFVAMLLRMTAAEKNCDFVNTPDSVRFLDQLTKNLLGYLHDVI